MTIRLRSRRLWLSLLAALAVLFAVLLALVWSQSSRIEERTRAWVVAASRQW